MTIIPALLEEDLVQVDQLIIGDELDQLSRNLKETDVQQLLKTAFEDSQSYHNAWVAKSGKN